MKFLTIPVLLLAMTAASLVQAQDAAVEPAAEAADKGDQMICTTERVTGSNLPRRVCMTAAERAAKRQAAQQAMSSSMRRTPTQGGN